MEDNRCFLKKYGDLLFDIFNYVMFVVALSLKVFYFQVTTGLSINEVAYYNTNINAIRAALCIVLIILSIVIVLFKKKRNSAIFVVNIILSILLLADILYFRYYKLPLSISLLYQLKLVSDVSGSMGSLFKIKDLMLFIDIPIYIVIYFVRRHYINKDKIKTIKRRYAFGISIVIFFIAFNMLSSYYKKVNVTLYAYDRNYAAKDLSILYYHYFDIKSFLHDEISRKKSLTKQEKDLVINFYKNKNEKISNIKKFTGVAKNRNLIIIQVEALQKFVIENSINNQEITPFLNSLIRDNDTVYFDNIFHQVAGGNTVDAEFLVNNSLYPIGSGAVYFRYPRNKYYSLPKQMNKLGYKSYASHAFKPSFWNRYNFYINEGFDNFYNMYDFVQDEKIGWATSDESFFRQTFDKIDILEKFYSFNITLSSHHPYDAFIGMDNLDVGKFSGKQVGSYLKAARYDDYALEKLFSILKEKGIYDNSIIVIYGDHSAIFEDQKEDLCDYLNMQYNEYNWAKIQQIPLFICVPGSGINQRVSTVGGQIDILPTITNLMDINMTYLMGKDLLNTNISDGYAVLRYSSVMTDYYMYLSKKSTLYDMKTGELLNMRLFKDDIDKKLNELRVSDIIINKDYFRKIKE